MSDSILPRRLMQLWKWLDVNGLACLSFFLLIFIPLYPKLPLFDAIPGYLVKVRLEDVFIVFTLIWWLSQAWRGKIEWWSSIVMGMVAYGIVGAISILSGMFLIQTIPLEPLHVAKSSLHFFRHIEYFFLFVFLYSAVTSRKQLVLILKLLAGVVAVVVVYALGQMYWEWPVYSTMNREYSKGGALTLGLDARVQSTFAGHYDLSAFLVLLLPFLSLVAWTHPRRWIKVWFGLTSLAGFWLLVETGSKFSLLAGIIGLGLSWWLSLRRHPKTWKLVTATSGSILLVFILSVSLIWLNPDSGLVEDTFKTLQSSSALQKVPGAMKVLTKADTLLRSNNLEKEAVVVEGQSENTRKYGLSMGIRLDTLWPQALRGVARNLTLGSGYGTLNKTGNSNFVEADSTDNNLLRTLGETGLLGFLTFYAIVFYILRSVWRLPARDDWLFQTLRLGLTGATTGILLNGLMIDVFVASKVAFTFWALAGIGLKGLRVLDPTSFTDLEDQRFKGWRKTLQSYWPMLLVFWLAIILLARNPFISNGQIANLALDPSMASWLPLNNFKVSHPYQTYLSLFYIWWNSVGVFYYANLLLILVAITGLYLLLRSFITSRKVIFGALFLQLSVVWLSQMYLLPQPENLSLLLLIGALLGCRKWLQTKLWPWLLLTVTAVLILIWSILSANSPDWWLTFSPLLVVLGAWFFTVRFSLRSESYSLLVRSGIGLLVVGVSLFILRQPLLQYAGELLVEYRAGGFYENVQTVRVLSDVVNGHGQLERIDAESGPLVFTALDSEFIKLYQKATFEVLPISSYVENRNILMETSRVLMVNNASLSSESDRTAFLNLRKTEDVDLVTDGCHEECNVYRINRQPELHWESILKDKSEYSFMIFNHDLAKSGEAGWSLLETKLQQLEADKELPDFVVAMSDKAGLREIDMRGKNGQVRLPVYMMTTSDSPHAVDQYLSLRTPHDILLFVSMGRDGRLSQTQHIKHLNALVDLEFETSLKNVFVFSDRLAWLEHAPEYQSLTQFGQRTVLPTPTLPNWKQLTKYIRRTSADHVYYFSGDFGGVPTDEPAFFFQQLDSINEIALASSVRWQPNDVYLLISVDSAGRAQVEAKILSTEETLRPAEFGWEHWSQHVTK